jgi:hypothetical protein
MTVPPSARERGIASVTTALIVALGPLLWLCFAVQRASYAGLGRDQGIFQGTAWAIAHGDLLYRDLREINGPLVHEIHLLARIFGGSDAHVLRTFDLTVSGLVFAFFGAALPGATQALPQRHRWLERLAWAAAACVVLLSQYVSFYNSWRLTQRESFFDWFVLVGFGGVLWARTSATTRSARGLLLLAGAASATLWFGKPQCALYTVLHVLVLTTGPEAGPLSIRRRLVAFAGGLAIGCTVQVLFLAFYAGIPEFLRIYFVENPRYYRYIWPRFLDEIVALEGHTAFYPLAIVLSLFTAGLVAMRQLGRHMLGLAAFPILGIGLDILQRKAFAYHLHPVTAGAATLAVALACHLATTLTTVEFGPRAAWWPLLLAASIAYYAAQSLVSSPHLQASWAVTEGSTASARLSPAYLKHYDTGTFASSALVEVATFLKQHTLPSDRIQLYGMDPYLLALAQRHSATPYIYGIDLNPDAVLAGIAAAHGSSEALEAARAIARRNVADFVVRISRQNPAAFVFFDHAPFMHPKSGFDEFVAHVPALGMLFAAQYRAAPAFGLLHVYLRNDRWPQATARKLRPGGAGRVRVSARRAGSSEL